MNAQEFKAEVTKLAEGELTKKGCPLNDATVSARICYYAAWTFAGEIFDSWTQKDLTRALAFGMPEPPRTLDTFVSYLEAQNDLYVFERTLDHLRAEFTWNG